MIGSEEFFFLKRRGLREEESLFRGERATPCYRKRKGVGARHVVPLPIDSLTRVQARREGELHAM